MEHLKLVIDACGTAGIRIECRVLCAKGSGRPRDRQWITPGSIQKVESINMHWGGAKRPLQDGPWWWWSGDALKLLWEVRWNCKSWKCNFIYMVCYDCTTRRYNSSVQITHTSTRRDILPRSVAILLCSAQGSAMTCDMAFGDMMAHGLTHPQCSDDNNNIM